MHEIYLVQGNTLCICNTLLLLLPMQNRSTPAGWAIMPTVNGTAKNAGKWLTPYAALLTHESPQLASATHILS
jgi:hypothetical protein